jgi:hypothetical protein
MFPWASVTLTDPVNVWLLAPLQLQLNGVQAVKVPPLAVSCFHQRRAGGPALTVMLLLAVPLRLSVVSLAVMVVVSAL